MCLLCRFLYAPVCCYPLADSPVLPSVSPASRRCFSTPKKLANTSLYSPALPLAAHLLPHYFILLIPVLVLCFPSHMRSLAHNQVAKLNNLYHLCKLFRFFCDFFVILSSVPPVWQPSCEFFFRLSSARSRGFNESLTDKKLTTDSVREFAHEQYLSSYHVSA